MFEHAKNIWEGENLYLSGSPLPKEPCTEATQLFYGEIENYDFSKPVFSWKTGHFTQVVWKNTKEIGAAKRIRNDSKLVVVIRYFPPGNLLSQEAFKKNVLPIPGEGRGGAFERCASLAFTGFVWVVGTCGQFIF
ncbi:Golgi-associated plant pathogenesis-related protein 1-like [Stylophora pistillata]|uniref:Golgi-associated plant pathogenesis-related protein 1-like n=1 Tax=Stylophora pistillata TaxID=50429 RepID=UPI000C0525C7|nr:Golgi-associated plant pathogenesis-related protein 1-like [Stylophora pistillata]